VFTELLDPRYLRGENVPNEYLAAYYGAAATPSPRRWSRPRLGD
jgi:hypothetical protein